MKLQSLLNLVTTNIVVSQWRNQRFRQWKKQTDHLTTSKIIYESKKNLGSMKIKFIFLTDSFSFLKKFFNMKKFFYQKFLLSGILEYLALFLIFQQFIEKMIRNIKRSAASTNINIGLICSMKIRTASG
jgi:hypothetical protein